MAYNNIDQAVTLPNQFDKPGDVWQSAIEIKERQQQRQDVISERQRQQELKMQQDAKEEADKNRLYNLKQIQEATNPKTYDTPFTKVNKAIGSELGNIYNEAIKYIGEKPEFVSQLIRDKIGNVAKWSDLAMNDAKRIEKQQLEFNRTFGNTDLNKVNEIVSGEFENNLFDKDEKGNLMLKAPHLINPEKNYFEPLSNPNVLAQTVNNVKPLFDFFKNIKTYPIEGSEYRSKKGNVIAKSYKGYTTPYTDEVTGDENKLELRPKSQMAMVDANGEPVRIADESLIKAMASDPQVESSFNKLWEDEVAKKGLQNLSQQAKDILKENFRYRLAEEQMSGMHQVNFKEKQIEPKTTNIINVGGKGTEIKDVYAEVKGKMPKNGKALSLNKLSDVAQSTILDYVRKIGNKEATQADVAIWEDKNGEVGVYSVKVGGDGITRIDEKIAPLSYFGTNTKVNTTAKQKQELIKKEAQQKPTGSAKKYKGLDKNGNPIFE